MGSQSQIFRVSLTTLCYIISDPNFSALPTYPVVLALKGADTDVNLFSERIRGGPVPGLPRMDPNRVVRSPPFPS